MNIRVNKAKRGFTLIEVMITTTILVVVLIGILATFIGLFALNENARKLSLAVISAQNKMEEIRKATFTTLYTTYNGTRFDPAGFNADEAEGNVFINNTNPNLLTVCVSVSWKERSNRIIGEDRDLDGVLDAGEDSLKVDGRLSSPAEIVTLMAQR